MRLRLDFADGWSHDRVVVRVGDQVVCRLDDVTTRPAVNLARSVELDLPDGPGDPAGPEGWNGPHGGNGPGRSVDVEVEVDVPDRSVRGSHRLTPGQDLVVVDAKPDRVTFTTPSGPYGYA